MDADDLPSDLDPDELQDATGSDAGTGADEDEEDDDDDDDDDDREAFGEYGISDDELMDPSDDDDHDEMGELGSEHSDDDEMGTLNESDFDEGGSASEGGDEEPEEEEAEPEGQGEAAAETASTRAAKPAAGSYVPPHLRKQAAATAPVPAKKDAEEESAPPTAAPALEAPPEDPRLRRQINGQLNKLSTSNMSAIVDQLLSVYSSNPRAVVSTTMISLLLGIISDRDNLGDQLVVTYAALVAALFRTVGIEFPAGVVARSVELFDAAFKKHKDAIASGTSTLDEDEGFEGRPGSKECLNLVSFIAELYNFQVVHCGLVYDFVRLLIESGLGELEVELLSRIVKRKPLHSLFHSGVVPLLLLLLCRRASS